MSQVIASEIWLAEYGVTGQGCNAVLAGRALTAGGTCVFETTWSATTG
jgi:hypothetical protein